MYRWLIVTAYAGTALLAFQGCIVWLGKQNHPGKAFALFCLTAFFGLDAMAWGVVANLKTPLTVSQYPGWLRAVELACILAAFVTAAKGRHSPLKGKETKADVDERFVVAAFAVYCWGIVVYWTLIWSFPESSAPLWSALCEAWHIKESVGEYALKTIIFYGLTGLVASALLWTTREREQRYEFSLAQQTKQVIAPYLWCYDRGIWPSLACWLPIPVAVYFIGGPTAEILKCNLHFPTWVVWTMSGVTVAAAMIGIAVGVYRSVPQAQRAASAFRDHTRRVFRTASEWLVG